MKKILAMMLTAAMMLSMGTAAMAYSENDDMDSVSINKEYVINNGYTDAKSPAETFILEYVEGSATVTNEGVDVDTDNLPIPTVTKNASFLESEAGDTSDKDETEAVDIANVDNFVVTLPEYTGVGIYTYKYHEKDNKVAGVVYYPNDITLVVTVIESDDGQIEIAAVHCEADEVVANGANKTDTFENEYKAGSLEVSKSVTGILGDTEKYFEVEVTFTAPEGKTVKSDIYFDADAEGKYSGVSVKAVDADENGWTGSKTVTIYVNDDDTITFTNIPYEVTYTVKEVDYTAEDGDNYDYAKYTGTINANVTWTGEGENTGATGVVDSIEENVAIENKKEGTVDTGISVDSIPYIAMLGVVAIGGTGIIVSKKRRSED